MASNQIQLVDLLAQTPDRKYIVFEPKHSGDFLKWWDKTKWAVDIKNKTKSSTRKIRWGEGVKTSTTWASFKEVALKKTGEPFVYCNYCNAALSHPSSGEKNTGTSKLKNHLSTKECSRKRGSQESGLLNFLDRTDVSKSTC